MKVILSENFEESKAYQLTTNSQKEIINETYSEMEKEFIYCHEQYLKAVGAIVSLPHVNEDGNKVIHGSNMLTKTVANYWETRRDMAKQFLSEEFVESYNVSHRMIMNSF